MTRHERPLRVAVVGGGCAALSTAFELTRPEHRGRYEVTVYQVGWRLGGKGASGRGPADRIEEHGLHLWLGFYENAFRLMRQCYAELGRDPANDALAGWQDAFEPAPVVAVVDRAPGGAWEPWVAHFPPGRGLPGDPLDEKSPLSLRGYLQQAASLLLELLRSAARRQGGAPAEGTASPGSTAPEAVVAAVEKLVRYGQLATAAVIFEAADVLRVTLEVFLPQPLGSGVLLPLVDAIAAAAHRQLAALVGAHVELQRIWQVIDLIVAILRGSMLFGLGVDARGFDAINDYDWRDWLKLCGATEASLGSGFVRGIYDLCFAFEGGDVTRPRLAAGVALRGAMRMFFTYRGALFWRMKAGMGDVVFAPLYEVLARRGVRFEFFHRLRNVRLGAERRGETPWIEALQMDVQARIKGGKAYRPLVPVHGLPCWPAAPDFGQLVNGARLAREEVRFEAPWETRVAGRKTLRVVDDFDFVVLGVGVGALPEICAELCAREPRWRAMVDNAKTVATQAFQVWMRAGMSDLGWKHPPVNLSGYVEPYDTWADMSHLIPQESWKKPVRSIAYFCSALPDVAPPGEAITEDRACAARAAVRDNASRFLSRDAAGLWPAAVDRAGAFRWEILAAPADDTAAGRRIKGEKRFDTQFWTANVSPSDRYTLSLPGSVKYRLSPLDMSFDNLTIAGDWTQSGLDSGCVESAVMSGMLAAHAVSGSPPLEAIVGYDHP